MKKHNIYAAAALICFGIAAAPAQAACYADYKAKQASPLQLHYGVIEVSDKICDNKSKVEAEVKERIGVDGWRLLNVMSVFGAEGLSQRKDIAGQYYLHY